MKQKRKRGNKTVKRKLALILSVIMALSLSGCDSGVGDPGTSNDWPGLITLATTTTGSTGYYIGVAQSQILSNTIEGVNFTSEATDGTSPTNGLIVQNDSACLANIAIDATQQLIEGTYPEMQGTKLDKLQLIMVGHATELQFVTLKETGITSLDQLKGKRVATLNPGTATRVATLQVLEAMGYQESDFAALMALTPNDMADALKDGSIDVGVFSGGAPTAAVSDLNSTQDIVMLQAPLEALNKVLEEHPGYRLYTITSDVYSDMTEDCTLLGLPMGMFCNADMDEDLVYEITKALNEGTDELTAAHAEGANWNTENTLPFYLDGSIPFHPGAARYYDEIQGN